MDLQQYFFNEVTLQAHNLKISPEYKQFLDQCITIVERNLMDSDFNVSVLATEIGMSSSSLYNRIKSICAQSLITLFDLLDSEKQQRFNFDRLHCFRNSVPSRNQ
jgi:AraC-like DNA-binding protein